MDDTQLKFMKVTVGHSEWTVNETREGRHLYTQRKGRKLKAGATHQGGDSSSQMEVNLTGPGESDEADQKRWGANRGRKCKARQQRVTSKKKKQQQQINQEVLNT